MHPSRTATQRPRPHRRSPKSTIGLLGLLLGLALAGCSTGSTAKQASPASGQSTTTSSAFPSAGPPQAASSTATTLVMTERALQQVVGDPAARQALAGSRVYEILPGGHSPPAGLPIVPTASFTSFTSMRSAINNGRLDPSVRAVLYDNEDWQFTPSREKANPAGYTARAASLAHANHLTFISAPAVNLASTTASGSGQRYDAYLTQNLAASAAKNADVMVIQAQGSERSVPTYASFVQRAAAQARAANPGVTVLAGVSTNPSGPPVDAAQLASAIQSIRGNVNGFWLNIPEPGPFCPGCGGARPDLGIDVLHRLMGG